MILDKVRGTVKKYKLLTKGDKIVVAVSGGPDSTALLFLLKALSKELKLKLHVAHLDHMLREDSRRDRGFTEALAKRLDLPVSTAQVDVKGLAQKGSLEEAARNARLDFFFKVARKVKAKKIALGHNLDDQAETVLMRVLRGAGLHGLSAILPKRNISGFVVIRPLLEVKRREIEAYLKRKKVKPCRDASNLQDIYLRNKVRNRLIPFLERGYNKNIKEVLNNLAESAGADYDYLKGAADRQFRRMGRKINLEKFLKLPCAIQRLILREGIARLKGNTRRITFQHIRELEDLVSNRPLNSIVDLPGGISARKEKKRLTLYRRLLTH